MLMRIREGNWHWEREYIEACGRASSDISIAFRPLNYKLTLASFCHVGKGQESRYMDLYLDPNRF